MANSQAVSTTFKRDLLNGMHAFGTTVARGATTPDTFKLALFLSSASRGAGDTTYDTTGELAGTGGYTQGGVTVTFAAPDTSGTTAFTTPTASASWTSFTSSGAFDCAVLYNSTQSNKVVATFTFAEQSITASTFTLTMPTNDASTGLLRIA